MIIVLRRRCILILKDISSKKSNGALKLKVLHENDALSTLLMARFKKSHICANSSLYEQRLSNELEPECRQVRTQERSEVC